MIEFAIAQSLIFPLGLCAIAFGLSVLAYCDVIYFEIDPLALLLVGAGATIVFLEMGQGLALPLAVAALMLMCAMMLRKWSPRSLGEGDLGLLAVMAFVSAPLIWPFLALLALLSLLTALAYSRARGKRAFKSGFPLALPACLSACAAFSLYIWGTAL